MRPVSYQLVLQFPESAISDFDDLVQYEDSLIEALGEHHDVDGHDIGSGWVNFFVVTGDPRVALMSIRGSQGNLLSHPDLRAAARPTGGDVYEVLLPEGDHRPFTVL